MTLSIMSILLVIMILLLVYQIYTLVQAIRGLDGYLRKSLVTMIVIQVLNLVVQGLNIIGG